MFSPIGAIMFKRCIQLNSIEQKTNLLIMEYGAMIFNPMGTPYVKSYWNNCV